MSQVRVTVLDAWDEIPLPHDVRSTIDELKRAALEIARVVVPAADYQVKYNGALIRDESRTLGEIGVPENGALIVLPRRRLPVK